MEVIKTEIIEPLIIVPSIIKDKRGYFFEKYLSFQLSDKKNNQLWVPPGFVHSFCVMSKEVIVEYKCTEFYTSKDEYTLNQDDNDLRIKRPIKNSIVSKKDNFGLTLKEIKI